MTHDPSTLAERIKRARAARGMRQSDLAAKLGVQQSTIFKYEKKGVIPHGSRMKELADALQVSLAWLSNGEGDPTGNIDRVDIASTDFDAAGATTSRMWEGLRVSGLAECVRLYSLDGPSLDGYVMVSLTIDGAALRRLVMDELGRAGSE